MVYAALADFLAISIKELVERDFGLSNGRPRALSQISDAKTPSALETPNNTV